MEIKGEPAPLCYAALRLVTARLRANPPRERMAKGGGGGGGGGGAFAAMPLMGAGAYNGSGAGAHMALTGTAGGGLPLSTVLMQVPLNAVGSVIGKGGANIQQVRQYSGARIKLHDTEQGASERTVEIVGSMEQLQV